MKPFYVSLILFLALSKYIHSQSREEKTNGVFYKFSIGTTLTINEDYTIVTNDGEKLIEPNALFINNTFGYQFDRRSLIGLNLEYDWHSRQGLHFFPAYLSFQYNILGKKDYMFVRGGYGTLLGIMRFSEKGNFYKLGLGYQGNIGDKNNILIGLDFTRKRFGYKTLEGLSSVSLFLEFMFL